MINKYIFTADRSVLELPLSDITDSDIEPIKASFDSGMKNVVIHEKSTFFGTACAMKYALGEDCAFSRVIYARLERGAYLCTSEMKQPSIDTMLKESLCRPFVVQDIKENKCFPENYLLRFEALADENTLVIIDGFDIAAPSPYMRRIFALPCGVLVLTDKTMNSPGENAVTVEQTHKTYVLPLCGFEELSSSQRELLMTLCAMLKHLDDGIPVISSASGVFDKESVRFYLGNLADELDALSGLGYLTVLPSGRIMIEKNLRDRVISTLCPDADNCRTFMRFVEKHCSWRILQNVKDISACIYTAEDDYDEFMSSLEFMCVYVHFSASDKNSGTILYNMLVSHMLENCSMQSGASYMGHLLFSNMNYCLSLLSKELENETAIEDIYDDELYMDELLPEIYTYRIKAKLDVIRLCLSFVRNATIDMYKRAESIFELLRDSMQYIFQYTESNSFPDEMKMALLDDVIRLCCESFDYFRVVDEDGIYCFLHDNCDRRRICYTCEKENDVLHADSICFTYSPLTVELYSVYCSYLAKWLDFSEKCNVRYQNALLTQLHEEKVSERARTLAAVKAHFYRIVVGYENYTDIYSKENAKISIFEYKNITALEKRLEDNKRFLKRGFDGGTLTGAERYTDSIINAVKESKTPLNVALTVLNPHYPLSDESFMLLWKKGFLDCFFKNRNTTNFSRQILLETLVNDYAICYERKGQRSLYETMIAGISDNVNFTEAFLVRMYHAVSTLYVDVKKKELMSGRTPDNKDFSDSLYEKYCTNAGINARYCDDYIAEALYSQIYHTESKRGKAFIKEALRIHVAENPNSNEEIEYLSAFLGLDTKGE